ncbi:hypothetical protein XENORESO_007522 [Xenotaenia resolanae]|uniref:Uncharacterized protein n=1 Tax=Xenotaenia resolanae TaxID=208358 RepID=A0ABV0W9U2_9TELE
MCQITSFFFPNERVELTEKLDDLTLLTTDASSAKIVENPLKLFKVDILLEGHKAVTKHFSTGVCVSGCVFRSAFPPRCRVDSEHTPHGSVYLFLKVLGLFFPSALYVM